MKSALFFVAMVGACLLGPGFAGSPGAAVDEGVQEAGGDALSVLNADFRGAYAAAREAALEGRPVVLVSGDRLLLLRDRATLAEATIRPPLYHRLKAVAHVPLGLRLLLGPWGEGPLSRGEAAQARLLRGRIAEAMAELGRLFPSGEGRERQRGILGASLALLDQVLVRNGVPPGALDAFARAQGGALDANGRDAARLQLEAMAGVLPRWRREHPALPWEGLRVVIIGSHMAREGEVAWQYFARLLGQGREGDRVVYAEEKWDPREALALLATHGVDGGLGEAFFGDPGRLHRDVMADAAEDWLNSHRPRW